MLSFGLTRVFPSPSRSTPVRRDSVISEVATGSPSSKMLRIQNLLNPEVPDNRLQRSISPPPTPASIANNSTVTSTPCPETPQTPASKGKKPAKDGGAFVRGCPQGNVKFEPVECNTYSHALTVGENAELKEQHRRFQLFPSGGEAGLIREFPKHIPYASDKKGFFEKTGREAFEVFQYTFIIPDDPEQKVHKIMWDYQNGLVRMTPFFKACDFSKTTPNKALVTNPGLKPLSHSITGGALLAQGYWVPFQCARAISLTFCYPIRWAMTPIFGPSFIKECLHPSHATYNRFKIDPAIVRQAQVEADAWRLAASRSGTPASQPLYGNGDIPRSVPPTSAPDPGSDYRVKWERPTFKLGSPFSPDAEQGYTHNRANNSDNKDASISPKSSYAVVSTNHTPSGLVPAWTSINRSPPTVPTNTPIGSTSNALRLLTQPHTDLGAQQLSWRGMDGQRSASPAPVSMRPTKASIKQHIGYKRAAAESDDDYNDDTDSSKSSFSDSSMAGNKSNIVTSPPPQKRRKPSAKRRCRQALSGRETVAKTEHGRSEVHQNKSTKLTSPEARAALLLVEISKGSGSGSGSVDLARRPVGNEQYY
ncbi:hypothetical protein Q7P37_005871 [Cladosporium fusiforme]